MTFTLGPGAPGLATKSELQASIDTLNANLASDLRFTNARRGIGSWAEAAISPIYSLTNSGNTIEEAIWYCIFSPPVDCYAEIDAGASGYGSTSGLQLIHRCQLRNSDGSSVLATGRGLGAPGHTAGTFQMRITANYPWIIPVALTANTTYRVYFMARRDGAAGTIYIDYWWCGIKYLMIP